MLRTVGVEFGASGCEYEVVSSGSEFLVGRGSIIDHDVYVTLGLNELRFDQSDIWISTVCGDYHFQRGEVQRLLSRRRKLGLGKWIKFELAEGELAPIELAVWNVDHVLVEFESRGWPTELQDP